MIALLMIAAQQQPPDDMNFGSVVALYLCVFVLVLMMIAAIAGPRWIREHRTAKRLKSCTTTRPQAPATAPQAPQTAPQAQAAASIGNISLREVRNALNILIVGPKGSGKTTLMSTLISQRVGYIAALDPHNEPNKWLCEAIGGGENFGAIHQRLLAVYELMKERYGASDRGERSQASYQTAAWRISLAGDEWAGLASEIPDQKATQQRAGLLGAGSLLGKLLARGRKVGIGLLIVAHDDTAAQLGLAGQMGLIDSFDYVIYLGGQATGNTNIPADVRAAARAMIRPAVVLDTERHEWKRLDTSTALAAPQQPAAPMPHDLVLSLSFAEQPPKLAGTEVTERVMSTSRGDMEGTASQSEVTDGDTGTGTAPTAAEIAHIAMSLSRGLTASQTAKAMRGYNGRTRAALLAKVEYVKGLLPEQQEETTTVGMSAVAVAEASHAA